MKGPAPDLSDLTRQWVELVTRAAQSAASQQAIALADGSEANRLLQHLCVRRTLRWPAWIDLWVQLCATPGHPHRAAMVDALHDGTAARVLQAAGKLHPATRSRLLRSAALVAGVTPVDDRDTNFAPNDIDEALLVEAVRSNVAQASRTPSLDAELEMPLLVVNSDGAGKVILLRLRATVVPRGHVAQCQFVRAPGSFLLQTDGDWNAALELAAQAVRERLPGHVLPELALVWDLLPSDRLSVHNLSGDSAGAAVALGALGLLRRLGHAVQPDLATWLLSIDWSRAVVTAALRNAAGDLRAVDGVDDKLKAWVAVARVHAVAGKVFVSHEDAERLKGDGQGARIEPCTDLYDLAKKVARHTDEDLNNDQARLRALLLLPDDDVLAPRDLLERCADAWPLYGLQAWLLARWARLALQDDGTLQHRFVNLRVDSPEGERSPDRANEPARESFDSLQQMLQAHPAQPAWLVTGMPGAGKTTLLAHHEMLCARDAIRSLARGEPPAEICVHVAMAAYPATTTEPMEWLSKWWKSHGVHHLPLQTLFDQRGGSLRLLFDGLNEINTQGGGSLSTAVLYLRRWLVQQGRSVKGAIFSMRELERSVSIGSDQLPVRVAHVLPWDENQQEAYCQLRLPDNGRGAALWQALQDHPDPQARHQLLDLLALPMNLSFQCELYQDIGRLALNRAELFSAIAWKRLRREFQADRLHHPGLLAGEDVEMLARESHDWKDNLFDLPVGGLLVRELDRQGYAQLAAHGGNARRVEWHSVAVHLDDNSDTSLREAWLRAAQNLGLARRSRDRKTFEFTHQLWGEFFAARWIICASAQAGFTLPDGVAPDHAKVIPIRDAIAAAAWSDEPLPIANGSSWEEPLKLAAQLGRDPLPLIEAVETRNPTLAARMAATLQRPTSNVRFERLRCTLISTLRQPEIDLRLRIEAGLALGEVGDTIRFESCVGPFGRYIVPREDVRLSSWADLEKGRYDIGSDVSDARRLDSEIPIVPVELNEFRLSALPVTNAEWRCFIEGGGYERNPRWWCDGESQAWLAQCGRESPRFWDEVRYNNPLQPVVGVSWWEAQAYARWLTVQTREHPTYGNWLYRLPTEAEWEVAARGRARNIYPWGNTAPDFDRCNYVLTGLRMPSPVGSFPRGDRRIDSRQVLCDMSGNVGEWTSSRYTAPPTCQALVKAATNDDGSQVHRTVRGGDWNYYERSLRAAARSHFGPDLVFDIVGLRLAATRLQGAAQD